jgi:lipid II:glycine glycyltransferase (peptidoglycan interpeptide bridge formation enzyme)
MDGEATSNLARTLRRAGIALLVTDAWRAAEQGRPAGGPRTIWVELSRGAEELMRGLDPQCRSRIGQAKRKGVSIRSAASESEVSRFFELCTLVSRTKGFELPGSLALMRRLVGLGRSGDVEVNLLLAHHEGSIAAGVFLMRCGRSLHYIWGASDRDHAKARVGEAVQWAAIEWGLERGCNRYDLEGIDARRNPGVYQFKRKWGGAEVELVGKRLVPLDWRGAVTLPAVALRESLRS